MRPGMLSVTEGRGRAPTPYIQRRAAGWRLLLITFLRSYALTLLRIPSCIVVCLGSLVNVEIMVHSKKRGSPKAPSD
jgi:hypothetical protein